jgi:glycosyltransferase involved in cell wall biosynthesis
MTADSTPKKASVRRLDRVVIVSPGGTVGGGGTGSVSREIYQWLQTNRPDIETTVLDPRGVGPAALWPWFLACALAQMVWQRLRGAKLLHVQVTERGSFLRKGIILRAGKMMGMRCLLHHHGASLDVDFKDYSPRAQRWLIATACKADLNVALGERGRKFLNELVGVPLERIAVLPNAISDLGQGERGARVAGQPMHYLLMANLSPRKGVSEFLLALGQLRDEGRPVRATLAGGEQVARYQQEADRLGLSEVCHFTGWIKRDRVMAMLAEAGALVLPSYHEVLPMVILEALSARVPVIATPVGSIPEVLNSGKDCILVPPGDVNMLAQAMRDIADDAALCQRLVENGRARYEEHFEMRAYMKQLLAIYAQVLNAS